MNVYAAAATLLARPHARSHPFATLMRWIERFFNKLKHFRRVATRYDKPLANFMGFVTIAAISAIYARASPAGAGSRRTL